MLFFSLELPDTIVYKRSTAFVDFNFTFLFIHVGTLHCTVSSLENGSLHVEFLLVAPGNPGRQGGEGALGSHL